MLYYQFSYIDPISSQEYFFSETYRSDNQVQILLPMGQRPEYHVTIILRVRDGTESIKTLSKTVQVQPLSPSAAYGTFDTVGQQLYNAYLRKDSFKINQMSNCLSSNIFVPSPPPLTAQYESVMWYILQSLQIECNSIALQSLFFTIRKLIIHSLTPSICDLILESFTFVQNNCFQHITEQTVEDGIFISSCLLDIINTNHDLTILRCFIEFLRSQRSNEKLCGELVPNIITPNIKLASIYQYQDILESMDLSIKFSEELQCIVPAIALQSRASQSSCWIVDFTDFAIDPFSVDSYS